MLHTNEIVCLVLNVRFDPPRLLSGFACRTRGSALRSKWKPVEFSSLSSSLHPCFLSRATMLRLLRNRRIITTAKTHSSNLFRLINSRLLLFDTFRASNHILHAAENYLAMSAMMKVACSRLTSRICTLSCLREARAAAYSGDFGSSFSITFTSSSI